MSSSACCTRSGIVRLFTSLPSPLSAPARWHLAASNSASASAAAAALLSAACCSSAIAAANISSDSSSRLFWWSAFSCLLICTQPERTQLL